MEQTAPDPILLRELVKNLKYKEGWDFQLDDIDRGQGSNGLTLIIEVTSPNSYYPKRVITVSHFMIVPAANYNKRSWCRWLLDQILLVERHEACEFFQIEGHRPYAPNHGPGNDPYTIFDQGFKEDAQTDFRGNRFELEKE